MREDMFKVIVERPRSGRSWATKSKLRYDKCEDRTRVSGKRIVYEHSGNTKHLNENLAPLKRFLHKQAGRKWNDVFSEICKHLDTGSTVKMHVREHIDDFVKRDIWYDKNGTLRSVGHWRGSGTASSWWTELYVDPADGVLKRTADLCQQLGVSYARTHYKKNRKKAPHPNLQRLTATTYNVKLKGIWYYIEVEGPVETTFGHSLPRDAFYKDLISENWRYHLIWKVVKKVQLSKKALSKNGLVNSENEGRGGAYG